MTPSMSIIEMAKLNSTTSQAYPDDILDRVHDHPINQLDELLLWNWIPQAQQHAITD